MLLFALLGPGPAAADPVPIVLGDDNEWVRDPDVEFPLANFALDLRRFAQLPNQGPTTARPLGLRTIAGDDRLFVVAERFGNSLIEVAADGASASTMFTFSVPQLRTVRDVAFHPQFLQEGTPGHGKLYLMAATSKPADATGLHYLGDSTLGHGDNLLAEFTATFTDGRFDGIDSGSYRELLRVAQETGDHPIGQGGFNPYAKSGDDDYGLLYFTIGDSFQGSAVSQDGQSALGKTLRIDPLQNGDDRYSTPDSNPFTDDDGVLDELYTIGHRNPHSLSFAQDGLGNMHLLVAEIGENRSEEVSLISAGGGNYGWGEREGTIVFPGGGPDEDFIYPVAQYGHDGSGPHAIAGGYVVDNGSELDGHYFFGDFPQTGDLFTFALNDALNATTQGELQDLTPVEIASVPVLFDDDDDPVTPSVSTTLRDVVMNEEEYDGSGRVDLRFGQGHDGELYILNKRNGWMYLVANSLGSDVAALDADFNGDGAVDGADLAQWEGDLGQNDESDANHDGVSDGADFVVWQRQLHSAAALEPAAVPEPSAVALMGCVVLCTAACALLRPRKSALACRRAKHSAS